MGANQERDLQTEGAFSNNILTLNKADGTGVDIPLPEISMVEINGSVNLRGLPSSSQPGSGPAPVTAYTIKNNIPININGNYIELTNSRIIAVSSSTIRTQYGYDIKENNILISYLNNFSEYLNSNANRFFFVTKANSDTYYYTTIVEVNKDTDGNLDISSGYVYTRNTASSIAMYLYYVD